MTEASVTSDPYQDPISATPLDEVSLQEAAQMGYMRAKHEISQASNRAQMGTLLGVSRFVQDVQRIDPSVINTPPASPEYHGQQLSFGQSLSGAFARGISPRNMKASDYEAIARRDLSERMAQTTLAIGTEVAAPSMIGAGVTKLATRLIGASGPVGIGLGIAAGFGVDALLNNDIVRHHLQRGSFLEQASGRFIRPGVSNSKMGRGFDRSEIGDISRHISGLSAEDPTFSKDEYDDLLKDFTFAGNFNGVRDVEEFKRKFTESKDNLKAIMETFHTSIKEGVKVMEQMNALGVDQSNVKGHVERMSHVAQMSGLSPSSAMQASIQMSSNVFGGTGIDLSYGQSMASNSLETVGRMQTFNQVDPETIRQLGGTVGAANAMTQMQGRLLGSAPVRRVMQAAFNGTDQLDMGVIMGAIRGDTNAIQQANMARNNLLSQGSNILEYEGREDELIESMPAPVAQALSAVPLMNLVNRVKELDPNFKGTSAEMEGLAMRHMGMGRNEASLLVSSIRNIDTGAVANQQRSQLNQMRIDSGHNEFDQLIPTRALQSVGDMLTDRMGGVITSAYDSLTEFYDDTLESANGIFRTTVGNSTSLDDLVMIQNRQNRAMELRDPDKLKGIANEDGISVEEAIENNKSLAGRSKKSYTFVGEGDDRKALRSVDLVDKLLDRESLQQFYSEGANEKVEQTDVQKAAVDKLREELNGDTNRWDLLYLAEGVARDTGVASNGVGTKEEKAAVLDMMVRATGRSMESILTPEQSVLTPELKEKYQALRAAKRAGDEEGAKSIRRQIDGMENQSIGPNTLIDLRDDTIPDILHNTDTDRLISSIESGEMAVEIIDGRTKEELEKMGGYSILDGNIDGTVRAVKTDQLQKSMEGLNENRKMAWGLSDDKTTDEERLLESQDEASTALNKTIKNVLDTKDGSSAIEKYAEALNAGGDIDQKELDALRKEAIDAAGGGADATQVVDLFTDEDTRAQAMSTLELAQDHRAGKDVFRSNVDSSQARLNDTLRGKVDEKSKADDRAEDMMFARMAMDRDTRSMFSKDEGIMENTRRILNKGDNSRLWADRDLNEQDLMLAVLDKNREQFGIGKDDELSTAMLQDGTFSADQKMQMLRVAKEFVGDERYDKIVKDDALISMQQGYVNEVKSREEEVGKQRANVVKSLDSILEDNAIGGDARGGQLAGDSKAISDALPDIRAAIASGKSPVQAIEKHRGELKADSYELLMGMSFDGTLESALQDEKIVGGLVESEHNLRTSGENLAAATKYLEGSLLESLDDGLTKEEIKSAKDQFGQSFDESYFDLFSEDADIDELLKASGFDGKDFEDKMSDKDKRSVLQKKLASDTRSKLGDLGEEGGEVATSAAASSVENQRALLSVTRTNEQIAYTLAAMEDRIKAMANR
jgi:hypothetical protein